MKRFYIAIFLFTVLSINLSAQKTAKIVVNTIPADYQSDGCSLFPDRNYGACCVAHDRDYYLGGSYKERLRSDNRLYKCVRDTKGWQNKLIAPVMWAGVRVFGVSFLPTSFRWGFGRERSKNKTDK